MVTVSEGERHERRIGMPKHQEVAEEMLSHLSASGRRDADLSGSRADLKHALSEADPLTL